MKRAARSGASFRRHASKQTYATPREFLAAVKSKFAIDRFNWDLAASRANTVARHYYDEASDSLKQDWTVLRGHLWLNPPFADIAPWARKCAETIKFARAENYALTVYFLVPASVGSNWFADHVYPHAHVFFLRPRLMFVGHEDPYPKDLMLAVYGSHGGQCLLWRWA